MTIGISKSGTKPCRTKIFCSLRLTNTATCPLRLVGWSAALVAGAAGSTVGAGLTASLPPRATSVGRASGTPPTPAPPPPPSPLSRASPPPPPAPRPAVGFFPGRGGGRVCLGAAPGAAARAGAGLAPGGPRRVARGAPLPRTRPLTPRVCADDPAPAGPPPRRDRGLGRFQLRR